MKSTYSFKTAIRGLKTNRARSFLTILGIVIGITAIILMMSIGKGAEGLILSEISGFGAEIIVIRPGQEPKGFTDIGETLFSDSLKSRDIEALERKSNVPHLVDIAPAVVVPGRVSSRTETYKPTIFGWKADFMADMFKIFPEKGVFFDDDDIRQRASVAVIGSKVERELFGGEDSVGEFITIKDRKFKVIGVLPERGQTALFDMNDLVVIPYTTAQTYILGIDHYHEVMIKVSSPDVVEQSALDIEATMRAIHKIDDPEKDDFFVVTQKGTVEQITTIIGALTAFLSSVVAIGLVVGGVGVMNIMLVSVTERTREIGLRKSLGATNKDILMQFLFEAVILTGIGGAIGVLLGISFSFLASFVLANYANLDWPYVFSIPAAILGIVMSGGVGLIFGIYPARKAAKKSPIEALRYE